MKKIITALALVLSTSVIACEAKSEAPKETKKVCIMQKDAKTQKEKEVCREVKVHKKLEGTKVPEKK